MGFEISLYVLLVRRADQMRLELSRRHVLRAASNPLYFLCGGKLPWG